MPAHTHCLTLSAYPFEPQLRKESSGSLPPSTTGSADKHHKTAQSNTVCSYCVSSVCVYRDHLRQTVAPPTPHQSLPSGDNPSTISPNVNSINTDVKGVLVYTP